MRRRSKTCCDRWNQAKFVMKHVSKILTLASVLFATVAFVGCGKTGSRPEPLTTHIGVEMGDNGELKSGSYSSPKDLHIVRRVQTEEGELVTFEVEANASDPATAFHQTMAEFYKAQTAQNEQNTAMLQLLGTALGANAQAVLTNQLAPPPPAELQRARAGQPLIPAVAE